MKVSIVCGDITQFEGDAVVNAANAVMLGGGGVDGAIHRAAGPLLRRACEQFKVTPGIQAPGLGGVPTSMVRCPEGHVRCTPGFNLNAGHILHTVAPVYDEANFEYQARPTALAGFQVKMGAASPRDQLMQKMRDCFKRPIITAFGMGLTSVAFPAIGCGVYKWTHEDCSACAMRAFSQFKDWPVDVTVYLYPADSYPTWVEAARRYGLTGVDAAGEDRGRDA